MMILCFIAMRNVFVTRRQRLIMLMCRTSSTRTICSTTSPTRTVRPRPWPTTRPRWTPRWSSSWLRRRSSALIARRSPGRDCRCRTIPTWKRSTAAYRRCSSRPSIRRVASTMSWRAPSARALTRVTTRVVPSPRSSIGLASKRR